MAESSETPDVPADVNLLSHILREIREIHARFDRMDGRLDRGDDRLGRMEGRFDRGDDRLDRLEGRIDRLDDRMATQFRWTVGLIVVSWLTLVGILLPPMLQLQSLGAQLQATSVHTQSAIVELQATTAELQAQGVRTQEAIAELQSTVERSLK